MKMGSKNLGRPQVWERTAVGLGDAGALSFLGLPCLCLRMLDKKGRGSKIPHYLRCFLAFYQKARQGMTGRGSAPDRAIEVASAIVIAKISDRVRSVVMFKWSFKGRPDSDRKNPNLPSRMAIGHQKQLFLQDVLRLNSL